MNFREGFRELIFCNGLSVDLDALSGLYQMRRCVEARAHAGSPQAHLNHGAGGTLPVSPCHVNEAALAMRTAQRFQQSCNSVQSELRGLNLVSERVEKPLGLRVSHPRAA